ncbi:hypothetical protein B6U98_03055 [Thermoplasmatales archaeon ex4572_165]|nr:MAG: hypothetical protein B6U98_03055 [Thermoplasmatales archaeon ex4572_165]RLF59000.1 MAG: hypothetical protein DRN27_03870 [Thermoplasmata archaeon]
MKIFAVADIHGAQYRVNEIRNVIEKHNPDIICVCGDITQFGPGEVATLLLDQLPGKVIVVPGNIDTSDVIDGIKKSHADNVQQNRFEFKGVSFLGLNGVSDNETFSFYSNPVNRAVFKHIDVLMTHVPPYGFQDNIFLGKHGGSKILYEIMQEIKPRLVLCGHIHENPGYAKTKDTVIVNCSMGKRGKGAIVHLEEDISVEMIN